MNGRAAAALDGPAATAAAQLVRGWRFRVWVAIAVVGGIVATRYPLVGVLGFELALVASVLAALTALDLGAALARRAQNVEASALAVAIAPLRLVAALEWRAAAIAVAVAAIPGVIAAIHGIWARTCDWWFGIESYLAMPIATAILFAGLGVAIGLITGPRRVVGNALPHVVFLAIAVWGVWRVYAAPPVFSYNPIIGYFPGNLYDERLELGAAVFWARLETLAVVVALLALCAARLDAPRFRVGLRAVRPRGLRGPAWIVAIASLALAVGLRLAGGRLGHAIDADDIIDELGGRIDTPHFVIHYARTPTIERDIALIAADHELRYAQVVERVGVAPSGKIHSFYFANPDQKAAWMGARRVHMAKPWRREIYLDHIAFPHRSLRHEIAHVVASAFGDPWFGVSSRRVLGMPLLANPGLIEGFAVATDWPGDYDRTYTPHQAMRIMQAIGHEPTVDDLLSLRFLSISSIRSYAAAGSFLRFLIERYGTAPIRELYRSGGDFVAVYGVPQRALAAEWRAFLATVSVPASAIEGNRALFSRGSVFDRPCPHAIAEREAEIDQRLEEGDRHGAIALKRDVCVDTRDPGDLLELANILAGPEATPAELAEAHALWRKLVANDGVPTPLRAAALIELGDHAAARGDWAEASRHVVAALALPVDDTQRRRLVGRWLAPAHPGPAGPALRAYFFGFPSRRLAAIAAGVEPSSGLAQYLAGLRALDDADWAAGARALEASLDRGLPATIYVRNAARTLAVAAFRAGDIPRVQRAIATLEGPEMSEMDRLLATDWRERLAFTASGRLR